VIEEDLDGFTDQIRGGGEFERNLNPQNRTEVDVNESFPSGGNQDARAFIRNFVELKVCGPETREE